MATQEERERLTEIAEIVETFLGLTPEPRQVFLAKLAERNPDVAAIFAKMSK
jgi:hypothetical protein